MVQIVAIGNVFTKKKKKIYLFGLCVHNRLDLMNNQGLVSKKNKREWTLMEHLLYTNYFTFVIVFNFHSNPVKWDINEVFPPSPRRRSSWSSERSHGFMKLDKPVSGDDSIRTYFCIFPKLLFFFTAWHRLSSCLSCTPGSSLSFFRWFN